jgi:hypothetical protein
MERAKQTARGAKHAWKQRGVWLVCTGCPQEHAIWVGNSRRMVGVNDDGSPRFADR